MSDRKRLAVYICHCGTNISAKVDVKQLSEFARGLPNVCLVKESTFMCSEPGQTMIQGDIAEHQLDGLVIASCSPLMHEGTFRAAVKSSGLNEYLMTMANIREQSSWVIEDPIQATGRAKAHVAGQVMKAARLEPLEPHRVPIKPSALVIGGGIAGMEAALQIAWAGHKVYLVEREPSIGGHMAQLDKTFPTMDCAACVLTPKMVSVGRHPNIELLTYSEVAGIEGYLGSFTVKVRKRARYVDAARCTGCGDCAQVCPVSIPNEQDMGLQDRRAIFRPFPQAVPNVFVVDRQKESSPCRSACPAGVNAHGYVKLISQGRYEQAFDLIAERVVFAGTLGRICPAPCERECSRELAGGHVGVRALKRFAADWYYRHRKASTGPAAVAMRPEGMAVVGSGPSGLACAFYLARKGFPVTVFEAHDKPGGLIRNAIPDFRAPQELVDREIELIRSSGVDIRCGVSVGQGGKTIGDLFREGFHTVYIAAGAGRDRKLSIPGEDAQGVMGAIEFLGAAKGGNPPSLSGRVVVVGVGNTAVDAARTALRLGARVVKIFGRESRAVMPAFPEEVAAAEAEGVSVQFLTTPVAFDTEGGRIKGVEFVRVRLDDQGDELQFIPVEGTSFKVQADTVLLALGQTPSTAGFASERIELNPDGTIKVDPETLSTNIRGVFAGGNVAAGPAPMVEALAAGRRAAHHMALYATRSTEEDPAYDDGRGTPRDQRAVLESRSYQVLAPARLPERPVRERLRDFGEVALGLEQEAARTEANRCLDCGGCCECRLCEASCEAKALDFSMKDEILEFDVGTIIVATGFGIGDPSRGNLARYGYKKYPDVYTSLEFERLNNALGPTNGKIRTRDGRTPESVAIIHCVGSRDKKHYPYCSRVCCLYSLKFASLVREKTSAEVYEFYIDMRSAGKNNEEFYQRLREEKVHFVRGKVAEVTDHALCPEEEGKLVVVGEDTLLQQAVRVSVDMVVLSVGMEPSADADKVAQMLRISRDRNGFFTERHPKLAPVTSFSEGIWLAGCAQGPKDIPDSVTQAGAAAVRALALIGAGELVLPAFVAWSSNELCSGCRMCMAMCPYSALSYDAKQRIAVVNEAMCKGCGTCVATCPSGAAQQRMFGDAQLFAEIRGILL